MLRAPAPILGALFGLMLSSCSLFGGTAELDVLGTQLDQVEMLYVIVEPTGAIAKTPDGELATLIGSKQQRDYITFAQYEPVRDETLWSWKLLNLDPVHPMVEIEAEDDEPMLRVTVESGDLLELHPQATLVLLANLAADQGWHWRAIKVGDLDAAGEMSLELGPVGFQLRSAK
jgi:hypothetical protein